MTSLAQVQIIVREIYDDLAAGPEEFSVAALKGEAVRRVGARSRALVPIALKSLQEDLRREAAECFAEAAALEAETRLLFKS